VQPCLDRFFTETQAVAGFLRAQAFDVAQHEHAAIRVRQRIDGVFEHAAKLLRVCLALGIRLR